MVVKHTDGTARITEAEDLRYRVGEYLDMKVLDCEELYK